jgi:hypothetical protein
VIRVSAKPRKEDDADRWLREHDPYYTSMAKNKMKKEKYPYETPELERQRMKKEIPFSSLSLKQRKNIPEVVEPFDSGY